MSVPEAVSNLKLVLAFKGHSVALMDCITTTTDSVAYVIDDDIVKVSRFATYEEALSGGLVANNDENHDLHLLAIDNKLMANIPGGIADCALFDKDTFLFVEFKLNAQGYSEKGIADTYEKAISQIEHTISIFKEKIAKTSVDFAAATQVMGIVIVSNIFPRQRAMEQNYKVKFGQRTGLELSFEPRYVFS